MLKSKKIIRASIKGILLIISISLSLVSVIGLYSTFSVLTNENNTDFDLDKMSLRISSVDSHAQLNFLFNNTGYYDISDANVRLGLKFTNKYINTSFLVMDGVRGPFIFGNHEKSYVDLNLTQTDFIIQNLNGDVATTVQWFIDQGGTAPGSLQSWETGGTLSTLANLVQHYRFTLVIDLSGTYTLDLVDFHIYLEYTITNQMLGL